MTPQERKHALKQSRPQVQTLTDGDSVAEREYRSRLEKFKNSTTRLERIDRRFSRLRMATFCAIGFVGLLWATEPETPWYWILIPTAVFLILLRLHAPFVARTNSSPSVFTRMQ